MNFEERGICFMLLATEAVAGASNAGLTGVLNDITSIYTTLIGNVGEVFNIIQTYPVALIPIGITLAFTSVKFCKYILGL